MQQLAAAPRAGAIACCSSTSSLCSSSTSQQPSQIVRQQPRQLVPSTQPLQLQHAQQQQGHQRSVVARGILDSYRREKGIPLPEQQQQQQQQGGLLDRARGTLTGLLGSQQPGEEDGSGDSPCFVECVTQVFTLSELQGELEAAGPDALVVVDFYKTACGACKYIQPGFVKLCHAAAQSRDGDAAPPIVFLKHNVFDDDEEEVTDLAKHYNVRSVPRFIFFKGGKEVDNFATRDKAKVAAAVLAHAPEGVELGDWDV